MSWNEAMTQLQEISQIAVVKVVESPKAASAVFAYSTLAGVAAALDWMSGALPSLAILAGLIGALVLAWANWKRGLLLSEQVANEKIRGRLLRERVAEMGAELRTDDLP